VPSVTAAAAKPFPQAPQGQTAVAIGCHVLLLIALLLFVRHQWALLNYNLWEDEIETIVVVKMMASGQGLFSEIFNHHGPLTFLPGYVLAQFGDPSIADYRLMILGLQGLALLALYTSPLQSSAFSRCLSVALAACAISAVLSWLYGNMYKYQVLAGMLLLVAMAQYTLPSLLKPERLTRTGTVLGAVGLVCLPFLAITYLPAAVLLLAASLRRPHMGTAAVAAMATIALNLLFLSLTGSVSGYLAYHFYLNTQLLPRYGAKQPFLAQVGAVLGWLKSHLAVAAAGGAIALTALGLAWQRFGFRHWRLVLIGLAAIALSLRGPAFQRLPVLYGVLATVLILPIGWQHGKGRVVTGALGLLLVALLLKTALLLPSDRQRIASKQIPDTTEFAMFAQALTSPSDRILAFTFANYQYVASHRQPASAHFFYLPPQRDYAWQPAFGLRSDLCEDLNKKPPAMMFVNEQSGLDVPWKDYAQCVDTALKHHYQRLPHRPYFISNRLYKDLNVETPELATLPIVRAWVLSTNSQPADAVKASLKSASAGMNATYTPIDTRPGTTKASFDKAFKGMAESSKPGSTPCVLYQFSDKKIGFSGACKTTSP